MDVKRKRGRPRKVVNVQKTTREEDDNIVLFLDIDSDNDNKNDNKKDNKKLEDNNKKLEDNNETIENESPRFVEDESDECVENLDKLSKKQKKRTNKLELNTKSSSKDIENLIEEIKKRDKVILKLKSKLQDRNLKGNENIKKSKINYNCVQVKNINTCKEFTPEKTDVHCWWCDYGFDCMPTYLVGSYKDNSYYVYGNFCSFNCALKYNNCQKKDYMTNTRNALLHKFKYELTGNDEPIAEAQDRELLKSKGGKMSIEEYRRNFTINNLKINMSMPPIIPLIHTIEKTISD